MDAATLTESLIVVAAGFLAGGINVAVGAGTLVSFPMLVMLGHPPLVATVSNTIGIVPGSAAGVAVYRAELRARREVVRVLLPASAIGGVLGATILLSFPAEVFAAVIPWFIGVGILLVVLGPAIKRRVASESAPLSVSQAEPPPPPFGSRPALLCAVFGAFLLGTYGGYFSAAQGIVLIAILGVLSNLTMQELNAMKNVTVLAVNIIAAVVILIVAPTLIDWTLVTLIAFGATCGGVVGGRVAKRLPAHVLRLVVVAVAGTALVVMISTS